MSFEYYIVISIVIFSIVNIFHHYFLNIYETTINVTPNTLKFENESKINITVKPINSFGMKIPFRNIYTKFKIIDGLNLIYIEHENNRKGLLELNAKGKSGKVKIEILSKYSLFPNIIQLDIK